MNEDSQKSANLQLPCRDSYHHGDLHNSLLEAADCLLEQTGAAKLSLREVAKHAGVSHTAPYRHFKNRAAMLEAIAIAGFGRLKLLMEQAEASAPNDSEAQLRAAGLAYLQLAVNNPEHTRLMFGGMMKGIAQDFVRYVMHVQVVAKDEEGPKLGTPQVLNMQTSSSDDEPASSGFDRAAAAQAAEDSGAPAPTPAAATTKQQTVTKDAFEKTPRNAPCPCGSGKKYKHCHGAY